MSRAKVPNEFVRFFFIAAMDPFIDTVYRGLRIQLAALLEDLDLGSHNVLSESAVIFKSVKSGRGLVAHIEAGSTPMALAQRVSQLLDAIPGLPFQTSTRMQHSCDSILRLMMETAIEFSLRQPCNPKQAIDLDSDTSVIRQQLRSMLLQVLASCNAEVRKRAYVIISSKVSVHPISAEVYAFCLHFLQDTEVVYELAAYGLSSESTKSMAIGILESIPAALGWDAAADVMRCCLPVLCAHTADCRCSSLTESLERHSPNKPDVVLNRLRSGFSADAMIRKRAFSRIADMCRDENRELGREPVADSNVLVDLSLSSTLRAAVVQQQRKHSMFQTQEVLNLLAVYTSDHLDQKIRAAAAEHLLQLFEDGAQLNLLLRHELLDAVLSVVSCTAEGKAAVSPQLLLKSLEMLQRLVIHSSEARAGFTVWDRLRTLLPLIFDHSPQVRLLVVLALRYSPSTRPA